ncbi:sensor histidine kinase [Paraflavitalea soli]|uniref:Sensor histidine kinase n=1 Tax=Paraflavitalea soli TaxID=2315862 RepID=A0A3B7MM62_9BACT|nr:histidine kinase [Paraflavitalea soli]AXY74399.1 sensor histidine kinase [Paraflavitalea soli]
MQSRRTLSLYWKCQLTGWSVASLYWNFVGFIGTGFSIWLALIHFFADLLIYIPITHLYRNYSVRRGYHQLRPQQLLIRLIPAIILLGLLFMLLTIAKNFLVRYWFEAGFSAPLRDEFRQRSLTTFITGTRLMSIWLLAYYGYHYAQREIKATRESARLAIIAKDAQLNNLTAQLNPHFFFNSLNNIKAQVIDNPQAARRAIDLLSEVLRTSLYNRDTTLITVQQEMALIADYLELEKMRFEERLQTHIEVDPTITGAPILPLSIQTLVENAIKHGIARRKAGGKITITIQPNDQGLRATVENPGTLQAPATSGLGLKNLAERLHLQFNGKASLQLTQPTPETVIATITMPLT